MTTMTAHQAPTTYRRADGATLTIHPDGTGTWRSGSYAAPLSARTVEWELRPDHAQHFGWRLTRAEQAANCARTGHPLVTFNPWLERSWCLCAHRIVPGDQVTLPLATSPGGPLNYPPHRPQDTDQDMPQA